MWPGVVVRWSAAAHFDGTPEQQYYWARVSISLWDTATVLWAYEPTVEEATARAHHEAMFAELCYLSRLAVFRGTV